MANVPYPVGSVVPPTSRNPNPAVLPVPDTNNTLSHPTGPEYQFSVGEGVYVLRDDVLLGVIPPHPAELPAQGANVLDTKPVPPTTGTKLSLLTITPRRIFTQFQRFHGSGSTRSVIPSIKESGSEASQSGSDTGSHRFYGLNGGQQRLPAFGEGNLALTSAAMKDAKDPLKRRKPKSNIVKSSSSFVSRVVQHELLSKRLQDRKADGVFAFANISRALIWLDFFAPTKAESLTKILFTRANPLCHDVNNVTKTSTHLDVAIGFSSADIIWYEPMSQKYSRINKNGIINASPVAQIRWMPDSENFFLAAHFDGTLVVYDKEKEDAPFVPEDIEVPRPRIPGESEWSPRLQVKKSVYSKNQKTNPVACWKLTNLRINSFEISPDRKHLAAVSEDGSLRVIDLQREQLLDLYSSYYGGITCVCWSADSRYIVTGGQDDLVSIWSLEESALVARCEGHHSWITAVAFDPWRCDDRNYRFGSVGEDCRLLLWDFSVGMLHRPRAASIRQRGSIASHGHLSLERTQSQTTIMRLQSESNFSTLKADEEGISHPVQPRSYSATLPPVSVSRLRGIATRSVRSS